jgi:carbonic anhydrase
MIRGVLEERAPNHVDEVRKMEFGKIDEYVELSRVLRMNEVANKNARSLTASIQEDVGVIRECPFIRKELSEQAQGLFFDIKTGVLNKVA